MICSEAKNHAQSRDLVFAGTRSQKLTSSEPTRTSEPEIGSLSGQPAPLLTILILNPHGSVLPPQQLQHPVEVGQALVADHYLSLVAFVIDDLYAHA